MAPFLSLTPFLSPFPGFSPCCNSLFPCFSFFKCSFSSFSSCCFGFSLRISGPVSRRWPEIACLFFGMFNARSFQRKKAHQRGVCLSHCLQIHDRLSALASTQPCGPQVGVYKRRSSSTSSKDMSITGIGGVVDVDGRQTSSAFFTSVGGNAVPFLSLFGHTRFQFSLLLGLPAWIQTMWPDLLVLYLVRACWQRSRQRQFRYCS